MTYAMTAAIAALLVPAALVAPSSAAAAFERPSARAAQISASAALAAPVKLKATVGPGFTISLKKGTVKVKTLKAGKYVITVSDKSAAHNFHLLGPGVNKRTTVSAKGTSTWKVTLKKGKYRFLCDPHPSSMKGSFTVVAP